MPTPQRDQVEAVLADIIRESLIAGDAAHVPGLGTFVVRHRSSSIERSTTGELVMSPPRDEIVFSQERQS